jgi:hypothetical protein
MNRGFWLLMMLLFPPLMLLALILHLVGYKRRAS